MSNESNPTVVETEHHALPSDGAPELEKRRGDPSKSLRASGGIPKGPRKEKRSSALRFGGPREGAEGDKVDVEVKKSSPRHQAAAKPSSVAPTAVAADQPPTEASAPDEPNASVPKGMRPKFRRSEGSKAKGSRKQHAEVKIEAALKSISVQELGLAGLSPSYSRDRLNSAPSRQTDLEAAPKPSSFDSRLPKISVPSKEAISRIGSGMKLPLGKRPAAKSKERKTRFHSPDDDRSPRSPNRLLYSLRAQLQLERDLDSEALTANLKAQFESDRENPEKMFAYATALARSRKKKRRKKSLRLFQVLLRETVDDDHRRDLKFFYAKALFWNEEYSKSLDVLNKILAVYPNHGQVSAFRALLFEDYSEYLSRTKSPIRSSASPVRSRVASGNPLDRHPDPDRLSRRLFSSTAKRYLSGPMQSGSHSFAQAIHEDASEMIEPVKKKFLSQIRFRDLLQQLDPGFDILINPNRVLISQWECFSDSGLTSSTPNMMYLFNDVLIYASFSPTSPIPFVAQQMFPLYRIGAHFHETPKAGAALPSHHLTITSRGPESPGGEPKNLLVVYTRFGGLSALLDAIQAELKQSPRTNTVMVRISIHDSESLVSLGLAGSHKAIAITEQSTADQMRKVLIERMCSSLPVHHIQIISTECVDYRIHRVTSSGEEAVFESSDTPLRFLTIDPDCSLVFKPYPPRRGKGHHAIMVDEREEGQGKGSITQTAAEEDQGLIRIYFSDTPLLAQLEYNHDTFKTLFIRSNTTTSQVCKILINKVTDNLGSEAERETVGNQLEAYRLWGLSIATGRGLFLDVASHPWKIYKRAILQDPSFRFIFAPSVKDYAEEAKSASGSATQTRRNWKPWKTRPEPTKIPVGIPRGLRQHLRVDEDFNWSGEDPQKSFRIERQIGAGAYGSVFLATHSPTGKTLVIKEVFCGEDPQSAASIESEIGILKQCRHPDIVGYYGCCHKSHTDLWIFMDYCEHGSVASLLSHLPSKALTQIQAVAILSHVIKGLQYLHTLNVVHRDIKSGNILINALGEVKIADFGISKQLSSLEPEAVVGTPHFMSPEAVDGKPVSTSTDIWSVGITLIEMVEGKPPLHDKPPVQVMYSILYSDPPVLQKPSHFSPEFSAFIAVCLQKEESKRPSASELIEHSLLDPQSAILELVRTAFQQPSPPSSGSVPTLGHPLPVEHPISLDFDSPQSISSHKTPPAKANAKSHPAPAAVSLQDYELQIDLMTLRKESRKFESALEPDPRISDAEIKGMLATPNEDECEDHLNDMLGTPVLFLPLESQLEIEVVDDQHHLLLEVEQSTDASIVFPNRPTSPFEPLDDDEIPERIASTPACYFEEEID